MQLSGGGDVNISTGCPIVVPMAENVTGGSRSLEVDSVLIVDTKYFIT